MLPRNVINLVGSAVVLAVLAAGLMLVVAPLMGGARETRESYEQVAADNTLKQIQVDSLLAQSQNQTALQFGLTQLRMLIPSEPRLDTVSDRVVNATSSSNTRLESVVVGETVPFSPPGSQPAPVNPDPTADPGTENAEASPQPTDIPREQTTLTITISAKKVSEVADYADQLRDGLRLIRVDQVVTTVNDDRKVTYPVNATLTVTVFVQKEVG